MLLRTTHTVAMTSPSVPGMSSADSTEYVSTVTDRLGDLIIEDGAVSRIVTDNGFANTDGGSFDYCFYVTDHQGNNRMVIDENGTVHRIEHYYPFGLSFEVANFTSRGTTSRRSFGGKEFDRISGLDLYDQEARQYDPALLRFTRPDDLGDIYFYLSPTSFCLNNPIKFTDPSGNFTDIDDAYKFALGLDCNFNIVCCREINSPYFGEWLVVTVEGAKQITYVSETEYTKKWINCLYERLSPGIEGFGLTMGLIFERVTESTRNLVQSDNIDIEDIIKVLGKDVGKIAKLLKSMGNIANATNLLSSINYLCKNWESEQRDRILLKTLVDAAIGVISSNGGMVGIVIGGIYFLLDTASDGTLWMYDKTF